MVQHTLVLMNDYFTDLIRFINITHCDGGALEYYITQGKDGFVKIVEQKESARKPLPILLRQCYMNNVSASILWMELQTIF